MEPQNCAARQVLSENGKKWFDDVNLQRVLGASTHIRLIGDIFLDISERVSDPAAMMICVREVADYFTATRGTASQAIANAIKLMTTDLGGANAEEISASIRSSVNQYRAQSQRALTKIQNGLGEIVAGMKTLLLFDYSSTVAGIAQIGKAQGVSFCCLIPESRALDGGRPYVQTFLEQGHQVHFIPDSAICHFLPRCDAAFIGAETCYPDGTCFNTVGSELVALLCREYKVPFYVPTPLIKLDMRALWGYRKPPVINDHAARLAGGWTEKEREGVDFSCPELIPISPEYITAYITEDGILPPWAMYSAALAHYNVR